MQKTTQIKCSKCGSSNAVKRGFAKNKLQSFQKYQCKDCKSIFTVQQAKGKTYPLRVIISAISTYNLGYSLEKTREIINKKYSLGISVRTINSWINEYKSICTYSKLRKQAVKLYSPKTIINKLELNHIQPYTFKYHKAKLYLLFHSRLYNNEFHNIAHFYEPLKQYLEKISTEQFPHHIFTYNKDKSIDAAVVPVPILQENQSENTINQNIGNFGTGQQNKIEQRASQIKFNHLKIKIMSKNNFACKLAKLAANLANSNKDRHQAIQGFFLINDSTTVAIEVPVHFTNWDAGYFRNQNGFIFPLSHYTTPITGHIDILQVRNGLIHILDYKPEANKINPTEQLTIYALALSRKLNLPLYCFKCAWFDESNYFEFFPLNCVYNKSRDKNMVVVK